jgi:hypothetical protein
MTLLYEYIVCSVSTDNILMWMHEFWYTNTGAGLEFTIFACYSWEVILNTDFSIHFITHRIENEETF